MPWSPSMNSVAKGHNQTLKDIVRSMISLKHFHTLGCPAKASPNRPNEKTVNFK